MRTVLLFTLGALLCVAGAWWIAHLPGTVHIEVAGTTFEATTPVALTLIALLFLLIYAVVRLFAWLVSLPRRIRRRGRDSARRRGDNAVTRALTALAANDPGAARSEAERSRRLLGDTPLTLLLAAQAGRQSGREEEADALFRKLAERPDGRLLGLRGLLRQAMAREDWPAATQLAEQAEAAHPGAAWLRDERRRMALQTGRWQDALRLTGPARGRNAEPAARAALGVAAAEAAPDPATALRLSQTAWEAEPSLAPAATAYASRLRGAGKERAAQDVLRRAWSLRPHPDLAEAFLAPISEPLARHRAAQELVAAAPEHPDSALLLARTALDAGLAAEARRHAETARKAGSNTRRLHMLMADIADVEGDPDTAQEALRRVAGATPDPVWRCAACGTVHAQWHPVCESCGTPGRIEWVATASPLVHVPRIAPPAAVEGLS